MNMTSGQVIVITELFQKMKSKEDFLELLNVAKKTHYGEEVMPFQLKQLNYYINKKNITSTEKSEEGINDDQTTSHDYLYSAFNIQKKSGGVRVIYAPQKGLKEFQNAINIILRCIYKPHVSANGFIIGKSIVDNARPHVNQNFVYNLDLKDFFPSIDKSRVWGRLLIAPFNLNSSENRKKIANMISVLCCASMEVERLNGDTLVKKTQIVLPQGAPTSPLLSNAICDKLDIRLSGVAKRFGLNYSRYADDITFSSKHNTYHQKKGVYENVYGKETTFDQEVRRIIKDQNFFINESKVRLQKQGFRQEVTGLIVNEKINVNRKYINLLRKWIYLWETYGYEKSSAIFIKEYSANKSPIKKNINMINVVEGKLLYLKMIKGTDDNNYVNLKLRFDKLLQKDNFFDSLLKLWSEEGIEKAMELFYARKSNLAPQEH